MGLGEPFILCHAPPRVSTSSDWELPLHLGVAVRIKPTHKCKLTNNSCHVLCEPLLPSTLPISNVPRFFRPDDSAVPSAAGATWPWPPVALAADGAQGQGTLRLRAPQVPKDSGPGQPGAAPNTPQRPRPTHPAGPGVLLPTTVSSACVADLRGTRVTGGKPPAGTRHGRGAHSADPQNGEKI